MQYKKFLYFADCLIDDHSQAQDIVIVSFSRYWEKRAHFDNLKAIIAYMYVTIRNDCYKYHNRQKSRLLHESQLSYLSAEEESFAESRIILAETLQYIHNQVDNLSPHYRDVIKLLFIDEVSVKDAASKLGISQENVRKRKERGIQHLKLIMIKDKIG